jgi:hypothetical protein
VSALQYSGKWIGERQGFHGLFFFSFSRQIKDRYSARGRGSFFPGTSKSRVSGRLRMQFSGKPMAFFLAWLGYEASSLWLDRPPLVHPIPP